MRSGRIHGGLLGGLVLGIVLLSASSSSAQFPDPNTPLPPPVVIQPSSINFWSDVGSSFDDPNAAAALGIPPTNSWDPSAGGGVFSITQGGEFAPINCSFNQCEGDTGVLGLVTEADMSLFGTRALVSSGTATYLAQGEYTGGGTQVTLLRTFDVFDPNSDEFAPIQILGGYFCDGTICDQFSPGSEVTYQRTIDYTCLSGDCSIPTFQTTGQVTFERPLLANFPGQLAFFDPDAYHFALKYDTINDELVDIQGSYNQLSCCPEVTRPGDVYNFQVPEPAAIWMGFVMLGGLAVFGRVRQRRRRALCNLTPPGNLIQEL